MLTSEGCTSGGQLALCAQKGRLPDRAEVGVPSAKNGTVVRGRCGRWVVRLGIRTVPGRVLVPVIAALLLAGCGTGVGNESPLPTWPVSPETLPPATDAVPDGFRLATWALDPDFPSPSSGSTSMHILVWETLCASGRPTTGRMSAPAVSFGSTTVTIKIGVRPLGGVQACPGPTGTPAILILPEPLGARTLLDGGRTPVGPPSPGFIAASPGTRP